jgi:hypothetical protein
MWITCIILTHIVTLPVYDFIIIYVIRFYVPLLAYANAKILCIIVGTTVLTCFMFLYIICKHCRCWHQPQASVTIATDVIITADARTGSKSKQAKMIARIGTLVHANANSRSSVLCYLTLFKIITTLVSLFRNIMLKVNIGHFGVVIGSRTGLGWLRNSQLIVSGEKAGTRYGWNILCLRLQVN